MSTPPNPTSVPQSTPSEPTVAERIDRIAISPAGRFMAMTIPSALHPRLTSDIGQMPLMCEEFAREITTRCHAFSPLLAYARMEEENRQAVIDGKLSPHSHPMLTAAREAALRAAGQSLE